MHLGCPVKLKKQTIIKYKKTLTHNNLKLCVCMFAIFSALGTRSAPGYHINNVNHKYTSDSPNDLENAMNRTMVLTFQTADYSFSLDLELNTKIYGKNTKVYATGSNGVQVEIPRRYRAFQGTGIVNTISSESNDKSSSQSTQDADCGVTFYKDLRFHCVCVTKNEVYHVDLIELAERATGREQNHFGTDTDSGMILVIGSEVQEETAASEEGKQEEEETGVESHQRKLLSSFFNQKTIQHLKKDASLMSQGSRRSLLNDQSYLETFTSCFDGQYQYVHNLYIGHVTDTSYNTVFNNDNDDILTSIEAIFNDAAGANMIYFFQLNIRLVMGTVYIGASYSGSFTYSPALISSGTDISTRLSQFNVWREEYYSQNSDTNGLWHLLTNYHPPAGTVGIAWIGVICSYGYGTGVTNYISYSPGTWEGIEKYIKLLLCDFAVFFVFCFCACYCNVIVYF